MNDTAKTNQQPILQVKNATKYFGGLAALGGVSLELQRGELLGLIGPNGAGKTTLFNIVAGYYPATSGQVIFNGKDITETPADERCHMGIARTFQITRPFENVTVLENVMVGAYYGRKRSMSMKQCEEKALEIIEFTGLKDKYDVLGSALNNSERKRLELSRALAADPELLLLDEVIAGLNPSEVLNMMKLIREINSRGITILMIEHVMKAIMNLSHRIVVLNFGQQIAEGTPEEITDNPEVIAAYLGGGQKKCS